MSCLLAGCVLWNICIHDASLLQNKYCIKLLSLQYMKSRLNHLMGSPGVNKTREQGWQIQFYVSHDTCLFMLEMTHVIHVRDM